MGGGGTEGLFRAAYMASGAPILVESCTMNTSTMILSLSKLVLRTRQTPWSVFVPFQSNLSRLQSWNNHRNQVTRWDEDDTLHLFPYNSGIIIDQSLPSAWLPRADGLVLKDNPQRLVLLNRWGARLCSQLSSRDSLYAEVSPKFHSWRVIRCCDLLERRERRHWHNNN